MTETHDKTRKALALVQETQTAFWDAIAALEALTGSELDSTVDYNDMSEQELFRLADDTEQRCAEGRHDNNREGSFLVCANCGHREARHS